jgi:uncharacterized protein (TIGR00251 family)
MTGRPWQPHDGGLRLDVRLQPGASTNRIDGVEALADGSLVLKVRVGAPPEGGKANAALVKLLSKRWKLAKSDVEIVAGETGRRKTLLLHGDPEELASRLAADLG